MYTEGSGALKTEYYTHEAPKKRVAKKSDAESRARSRNRKKVLGMKKNIVGAMFMVFVMMFGCWAMMCLPLRCMMLGSRRALRGLMARRRMWSATFTSARSRHYWTAESYTGKSEYQKLFECLVHVAPSLSACCFMRTVRRLH
jgi:hypothetical protein